jgi:hypothetical protein
MARSPITWRNVAAPTFEGAADMMGQAQDSFTGAIKSLRDTKDTFERGRTDRNTQDFMAQLQQYGTSEELAAAQQSGDIANLRGQFGNLINQDKTNVDAVTGRVGTLQGQEDSAFNRESMLQDRVDNPLIEGYMGQMNGIDSNIGVEKIGQSYDKILADISNDEQLSAKAKNRLTREATNFKNNREGDYYSDLQATQGQTDRGTRLMDESRVREQQIRNAGRTEEEYQTEQDRQGILRDAMTGRQETVSNFQNTQSDFTVGLANVYGVSVSDIEDKDNFAEIQKNGTDNQRIAADALKTGFDKIEKPMGEGNFRNQLASRLMDAGVGVTTAQNDSMAYEDARLNQSNMSATAQKRLDGFAAQRDDTLKSNTWAQAAQNTLSPADQMLELTQLAQGEGKDADLWNNILEDNEVELTDFISKAASGQFKVEGVPTKIPFPIIKAAILQTKSGTFFDDNPGDKLERIIGQSGWAKELKEYNSVTDDFNRAKNRLAVEDLGTQSPGAYGNIFGNVQSRPQAGNKQNASTKEAATAKPNLPKPTPASTGNNSAGSSIDPANMNPAQLQQELIRRSNQEGQANYQNSANEAEASVNSMVSSGEITNLNRYQKDSFLLTNGKYFKGMSQDVISTMKKTFGDAAINEYL